MGGDAHVFDKAAFHLRTVRAKGLHEHQAYVHVGLFFAWAVDRGLTARWLEDRHPEAFASYRAGALTGPRLLYHWDGALLDDMFNDEGLAFASSYLDHRVGRFHEDYRDTLATPYASEFHVPDTPDSQRRLSAVLDERHAAWRPTYDPRAPRVDLRQREPETPLEVPQRLVAPVLAIPTGVPLPSGPLGIEARRATSVAAIASARANDHWLGLFPVDGGHPASIGVLGRVAEQLPGAEGTPKVVVHCLYRVNRGRWVRQEASLAELTRWPDPEVSEADALRLEEIRGDLATLIRLRRARGAPLGVLALAPALTDASVLDVIARELTLTDIERRTVLEAPDVRSRCEIVHTALRRESSKLH
ncbi:MAG: LON peptidase substrate-binding domain-containing protein [Myxococcales bacterium]|nr:LON peptidase substrate-binding domain-containing protein [Myxococcales bacterium]